MKDKRTMRVAISIEALDIIMKQVVSMIEIVEVKTQDKVVSVNKVSVQLSEYSDFATTSMFIATVLHVEKSSAFIDTEVQFHQREIFALDTIDDVRAFYAECIALDDVSF